jgi:hypothetical protein
MARWHEVKKFVGRVFSPFRKSRITTLAALVVGLLRKQQVGLAGIAQGMLDDTTVKHRVKRVGRFLGNKALRPWEVTRHLIETMMPPGHQHLVVVDWTDRGEYMLLKASLVYQRRALLLAWRHVWPGGYDKSQNAVEEELILTLAKHIGPTRTWVLVADRGFGRAELFRTLDEAGIGFVIRDADDVWVKTEGFEGRLWNLPRQRGKAAAYRNITYHKTKRLKVHLIAAHAEPAPQPWFLITNLDLEPLLVQRIYAKRFWIEEGIRDCKTGLSLKRLWLNDPERMDRMMIVVAIAMLLILLTGAASLLRGERPQVTTSKKKTLPASLFTLGARLLYLWPERLCTQEEILYAL